MMQFKAFKPEGLSKIAGAMGYKGDMSKFQDFIEQDPARMARMNMFTQAAQQMARGGMVNMQTGGLTLQQQIDAANAANKKQADQQNKQMQAAVDAFNKQQQAQTAAFNKAQLDAQNAAAGNNISPGGGSGGIQTPATGAPVTEPTKPATPQNIGDFTTGQVFNPALPEGGKVDAVKIADTVDPRT